MLKYIAKVNYDSYYFFQDLNLKVRMNFTIYINERPTLLPET